MADAATDTATDTAPTDATDTAPLALPPTITDLRAVVPGPGLPVEASGSVSNNNLDLARQGTDLLFAFRSAPTHFAGTETKLHVLRSADEVTWKFEATFAMGTDLREPRLLVHGGRTFLYFAVLGSDPGAFQPKEARMSERLSAGKWTESKEFYEPTFIPWRVRSLGPTAWLIGYTNGGSVYATGKPPPIRVHWLKSQDGAAWLPAGPTAVVLEGGISETDFAFLDDGAVVAVARNEQGENGVFGSKICRGEASALHQWTCKSDKRKYDSPLLFRHGQDVYLVGRRHVSATGRYDLGQTGDHDTLYTKYQLDYWTKPKRCALWKVDPQALTVAHVLDLPSKGDTCFASLVPLPPVDGQARDLVYNYSSPVDGPDVAWSVGQLGPTLIYRMILDWRGP
jgi:hypothetical protein